MNIINNIFPEVYCPNCNKLISRKFYKPIRQDDNCIVVHFLCENCNNKIAIALMGVNAKAKQKVEPPPISEKDVENAQKFIRSLDDNWSRYIKDL